MEKKIPSLPRKTEDGKLFTGSIKTGEDDTWEYFDTYIDGYFSTKSLKMIPLPPISCEEAQRLATEFWKKLRPEWYRK